MNNPDAAVKEIDRAVRKLGAAGVQIYTNVNGRPLDEPVFLPIFEKMAEVDRPIWVHPARGAGFPDYQTEQKSKYELWWVFGWPYETSIFMARILFAGYFDRWPNLKIITHHMGGMVPYFSGRTGPGLDQLGARTEDEDLTVYTRRLKKRPQDYFKMFYADSALIKLFSPRTHHLIPKRDLVTFERPSAAWRSCPFRTKTERKSTRTMHASCSGSDSLSSDRMIFSPSGRSTCPILRQELG
jgi:hypothetical protein